MPARMMSGMDGSILLDTARFCRAFLDSSSHDRWAERVPEMDWTVAETVAHMTDCCLRPHRSRGSNSVPLPRD